MRAIAVVMIVATLMMQTQVADAFLGKRNDEPINRAKKHYEEHEYFLARTVTLEILADDPANAEAQALMGKILDAEIERQKDRVYPMAAEDMDDDEKGAEVKTWLERSRALLARKEYDLALFAAEKVFAYDAENRQASEMIDSIKEQAIKDGKADMLFLNKMYEEEISDRLKRYRDQAQALAAGGYLGQARFTIEKILLLEPEDPKALKLYQDILEQEGAVRHEA